jgi:hypothetical protein
MFSKEFYFVLLLCKQGNRAKKRDRNRPKCKREDIFNSIRNLEFMKLQIPRNSLKSGKGH